MTDPCSPKLHLSGDVFSAAYRICARSKDEALTIAEEICVEQTVEFPIDLISSADILNGIMGKVQSVDPVDEGRFEAVVVFAAETAGTDFVQFLNVLFGNSGLKPGIRLIHFSLSSVLQEKLRGPRFGINGLRRRLHVFHRPLSAAALKPMGLDNKALACLARAYAEGGIDIVKDDHGLADQSFSAFEDRVRRCSDAVNESNERFSRRCLYAANITGPSDRILDKAHFAVEAGAGGLMIAPGLAGFDIMRCAAEDDRLALPIISHPAFLGSSALSQESGISHGVLFGQMNRAAGADISIFPSFGGRFAFSKNECRDIVTKLHCEMDPLSAAFPAPAGGMTLDRVKELLDFYGKDTVFLIGGDLHRHGDNLAATCSRFLSRVESLSSAL